MPKQPVSAWGPALLPTLHAHQKLGLFCDVELKSCDHQVVMVHSCVLGAASSKMCTQMLALPGGMHSADVELSYLLLRNLVDFIYTGTWDLDECSVSDIQCAAEMFEMTLGDLNMTSDGPTFFLPDGQAEIQMIDHCEDNLHATAVVEEMPQESPNKEVDVPDDIPVLPVFVVDVKLEDVEASHDDQSANTCKYDKSTLVAKEKTDECDIDEERAHSDSEGEESGKLNWNELEESVATGEKKSPPIRQSPRRKDVGKTNITISSSKEDEVDHEALFASLHQCECCWIRLGSLSELQRHRKKHTEVKRYKCKHCPQKFQRSNHRLRHQVVHTGEKDLLYTCRFCPATFSSGASKTKHQATHKGTKPYKCRICGKGLQALHSLKTHELLHMGDRPFKCDLCDNSYVSATLLKRHKNNHDKEKKYVCNTCGTKFAYVGNLNVHQRVHAGDMRHQCSYCKKGFMSRVSLEEHERTHSGERPYICEHCGAGFSRSKSYKDHLRIHTGERPYQCQTCGKTFRRMGPCRIHERIHSGFKPYGCQVCVKKFSTASARKVHEQTHLKLKPFTCSVCNSTFTRKDNLITHQIRRHTDLEKSKQVGDHQQHPDFKLLLRDENNEFVEMVESHTVTLDQDEAAELVGSIVVESAEVEIE